MRYQCWESRAAKSVQEQIWQLIQGEGWIADRIGSMRFWIPEHKVTFALLYDGNMQRLEREDYLG